MIRRYYDSTRRISARDKFKVGLSSFIEQCPDTPPVTGYTPLNDNSLLTRLAGGGPEGALDVVVKFPE